MMQLTPTPTACGTEPLGYGGKPVSTGESYDLVIVGGGISGLSAAYFYRERAGPSARVLIVDNHDDFGGHAKRNKFTAANRLLLSYGGTQSIESPGDYSGVAKALLADLGIDTSRFYKAYDRQLYRQLGTAAFFDRETFGQDRVVLGMNSLPWPEFLAKTPLSDVARADIARIYTEKADYLPGMSREQKKAKLSKISYADYLTTYCKVCPRPCHSFRHFLTTCSAVGIDAVSAYACYENYDDYQSFTYPGFAGLNLEPPEKEEPYIFHFPDGNASIARLIVRALIPGSMPGHTMDDVVTARADYSRLDNVTSRIRIRLNSTVVRVHQDEGHASAGRVHVQYMRGGKLQSVEAKHCVLACYNQVIPYLCPELPEERRRLCTTESKFPWFIRT